MLTSPSIPHNYQQPRLQRMERRFPQQTTWCGHPRSPARRRLSHRARRREPPQTTPLAYGTKGTCERSKNKVERYRSETRKTPLCSGLITPRITGSIGARTDSVWTTRSDAARPRLRGVALTSNEPLAGNAWHERSRREARCVLFLRLGQRAAGAAVAHRSRRCHRHPTLGARSAC